MNDQNAADRSNIVVVGHTDELSTDTLAVSRCVEHARFLERTSDVTYVVPNIDNVGRCFADCSNNGKLHSETDGDKTLLFYQPGDKAVDRLDKKQIAGIPDALVKRISKKIRSTEGALFTFVSEDTTRNLDVFITDWSPCPAACAIAVHRNHPFLTSDEKDPDQTNYFTGAYVRHPLTGDLLSVWVGDWVKPAFGTGAVLVNPAHSVADMEFGRRVGLPMRFALMPEGKSDEPEQWPLPPVIKEGFVVGAGRFDGLGFESAKIKYFETLKERNLAKVHIDRQLPAVLIAELHSDENGEWLWNASENKLVHSSTAESEDGQSVRVTLQASPAFETLAACIDGGVNKIFLALKDQKETGVGLVNLLCDVLEDKNIPEISVIQNVEYSGADIPVEKMRFALLVGEPADRQLILRKQLFEQIDGFNNNVEKAKQCYQDDGASPPQSVNKMLDRHDASSAFREMHKWQKEMVKDNKPINESDHRQILTALMGNSGN